ncbi:hypothetical protein [Desulfolithobacter sp.]
MIKKHLIILFVVAAAITFVSQKSFAWTCAEMEIVQVSQNSTWLKNVSGADCGNIANGQQQYFILKPFLADKLLAILLTATSLDKTVWVHAADDVQGSIIDIISIKK